MKSDAVIEKIKARVAAIDPAAQTVKGIFQLNIKGDDGVKSWVVDLKALTVSEGTSGSADVTVGVSDDVFVSIGTKQISAEEAAASGKLEIDGDKALASSLLSKLTQ